MERKQEQKGTKTVFYKVSLKQANNTCEGNGWGITSVTTHIKDKGTYYFKSKKNAVLHFQKFLKSRPKEEKWEEKEAEYPLIRKSAYKIDFENYYVAYIEELKMNFLD